MLTEEQKEKARKYRAANKDRIKATQRRWVEANKEHLAAYQKQWKLDNPDAEYNTEEYQKEYRKKYYAKNKDKMLAQMKATRAADPEKNLEFQRKWKANNEGHTYTDKKTGYVKYVGYEHPATNPSGITAEHRIVLWDKLKGKGAMCHWNCGTWVSWDRKAPHDSNALVVDHLNLIKSDNRPENLVPSCSKCNCSRVGGRDNANMPRGEDSCRAILTNEQVLTIKDRMLLGESDGTIAEDYSVDFSAIKAIRRGASWSSVGPDVTTTYNPAWRHMTPLMVKELVARIKAGQTVLYVADAMDRTGSTVARTFKRETGMSVMDYKRAFKGGIIL